MMQYLTDQTLLIATYVISAIAVLIILGSKIVSEWYEDKEFIDQPYYRAQVSWKDIVRALVWSIVPMVNTAVLLSFIISKGLNFLDTAMDGIDKPVVRKKK